MEFSEKGGNKRRTRLPVRIGIPGLQKKNEANSGSLRQPVPRRVVKTPQGLKLVPARRNILGCGTTRQELMPVQGSQTKSQILKETGTYAVPGTSFAGIPSQASPLVTADDYEKHNRCQSKVFQDFERFRIRQIVTRRTCINPEPLVKIEEDLNSRKDNDIPLFTNITQNNGALIPSSGKKITTPMIPKVGTFQPKVPSSPIFLNSMPNVSRQIIASVASLDDNTISLYSSQTLTHCPISNQTSENQIVQLPCNVESSHVHSEHQKEFMGPTTNVNQNMCHNTNQEHQCTGNAICIQNSEIELSLLHQQHALQRQQVCLDSKFVDLQHEQINLNNKVLDLHKEQVELHKRQAALQSELIKVKADYVTNNQHVSKPTQTNIPVDGNPVSMPEEVLDFPVPKKRRSLRLANQSCDIKDACRKSNAAPENLAIEANTQPTGLMINVNLPSTMGKENTSNSLKRKSSQRKSMVAYTKLQSSFKHLNLLQTPIQTPYSSVKKFNTSINNTPALRSKKVLKQLQDLYDE